MSAALLAPFRHRAYAMLWLATMAANTGAWMYAAAAGWLMTDLDPNPAMVAAVQVASTLPMLLFALPAGAIADVVDNRRFLIVVEAATSLVAIGFALIVSSGRMTATLLLVFTFLVEAAAAIATPAWQAIVPRLVPRDELPAAIAVNSVGYNASRAIGPAAGGIVAAAWGIAAPFWAFAFSNVGSIVALAVARPAPHAARSLPAQRILAGMRTGIRHARNNPLLRPTIVRAATFFFFASAYWALLPLVAQQQSHRGARLYGLLLGAIGAGAIGGAALLPRIEARFGADALVRIAQAGTGVALATFAFVRTPWLALAGGVLAGVCWIAGVSRLNVSAQLALPDWVRARGLALYVALSFGAMTLGSAAWGELAAFTSVSVSLAAAAVGAIVAIVPARRWPVRADGPDLAPSLHWPVPIVANPLSGDEGPVLVAVEYRVVPANRAAFIALAGELRAQRLRNGAYAWELFADVAQPARVVETFHVESWAEHLRQHERVSAADRDLESRVVALATETPAVTHLVATR